MSEPSIINSTVYVVRIRRNDHSESETFHMLAPTPGIAELRVRRLAKAPQTIVLSVEPENHFPA